MPGAVRGYHRLRARWYVLVPLLLATGLFTAWVAGGVNPRYEVTGVAVLKIGQTTYAEDAVYGSAAHTTQVLAVLLDAEQTRQRLAEQGLDPSYEVSAPERRTVLEVRVVSRSAQVGMDTVDAVLEVAARELSQRQVRAGTPAEDRYAVQVLQPAAVSTSAPWRTRNMVLVALMGVVVSVVVTMTWPSRRGH